MSESKTQYHPNTFPVLWTAAIIPKKCVGQSLLLLVFLHLWQQNAFIPEQGEVSASVNTGLELLPCILILAQDSIFKTPQEGWSYFSLLGRCDSLWWHQHSLPGKEHRLCLQQCPGSSSHSPPNVWLPPRCHEWRSVQQTHTKHLR